MTDADVSPVCPACGKSAIGNFCQHCGANLGGRFCNQCGTKVAGGARFCSDCGASVGGDGVRPADLATTVVTAGVGPGPGGRGAPTKPVGASAARREAAASVVGGQNLAWWIAGAAMFALIVVVGVSMVRPAGPAAPTTGAATAAPGTPPDISNMTPIEAATALFNRVMRSVSAGDSVQAQAFVPMAIAAYERARPLDHDGLFHLSMLNRTAMNLEAAYDNALEIVEDDPNHLLGLAAAAEAAIELGELDEAERHYRQIFAIYDEEVERELPEYDDHSLIVTVLKQDAERFLAGR